jgi:FMN reductase
VNIAVVTGNPKSGSRTLEAAIYLATRLAGEAPSTVVDVVDLGPGLLGWGDPAVGRAIEAVQHADAAVFASPTYKATYTGILKLFLDQFPPGGLRRVVAVPLMLGAGPGHAMAPDLLLKPVLVELGATCPTRGLYLLESDYTSDAALGPWLESAYPQVRAATQAVVS